jgi:GNAT superfamily N-acetyltransferase
MMETELVDDVFASTLRDDATVLMRRLEPTDIDAVIALHDTLTDRERYMRFFTMHPAYLKTVAHKLTEGRGKDYALGAFESGVLIGAANYVVCGRSATAEFAIVVAHNDHLRGVGTALLRRLIQIARVNGIQHFVFDVLTTNHLMFNMLRDAGLQPQHRSYDDGVVRLEIDLAEITPESDLTGDTTRPGVDLGRPEHTGR